MATTEVEVIRIEDEGYEPAGELLNAMHFVSNAKGGIGKSFAAKCLAEFFIDTGRKPICFDVDPANRTLAKIKGLGVRPWDLLEYGVINRRKFDALIEEVIQNDGPKVVDLGSTAFHSFWSYVTKNNVFELLARYERPVVAHVPLGPGADLHGSLQSLNLLCKLLPETSVVVWLIERNARILVDGVKFSKAKVAQENEAKLLGTVQVSHREQDFHYSDVLEMLEAGQTFEEAMNVATVIGKQRLYEVREEIFEQLREIGL